MVIVSSNPHDKGMQIRRKINSIFNKREEDFQSLREYNDYLEEVEDMGIDVPAIEQKISTYQEENAELIMINQARKAEDLAAAMRASNIVLPTQTDTDGGSQAGFVLSGQGQYAPSVAGGQPRPAGMAPQPMPLAGGQDIHGFALDDDEMMRLRAEKGRRAGGWSIELSKRRVLEEASASIWV